MFLIAAGALVLFAIGVVAFSASAARQTGQRPVGDVGMLLNLPVPQLQAVVRADRTPFLTTVLDQFKISQQAQWQLLRAGIMLKPSEVAAISLLMGSLGYLLGLGLLHNLLLAGLFAILGLAIPWMYVNWRKILRMAQMERQLAETLDLLSSSLRSGYSFGRATRVIIDEIGPPIGAEFQWIQDEVSVGVPMDAALEHMAFRSQSKEIRLMVTAVQIQSTVGGNLAEILESTADMVRDRRRLKQEMAAITAEGRMSAGILTSLPIAMGIILHIMNPSYLAPLFSKPAGLAMLGGAGFLMLLGVVTISRMLRIEM